MKIYSFGDNVFAESQANVGCDLVVKNYLLEASSI